MHKSEKKILLGSDKALESGRVTGPWYETQDNGNPSGCAESYSRHSGGKKEATEQACLYKKRIEVLYIFVEPARNFASG